MLKNIVKIIGSIATIVGLIVAIVFAFKGNKELVVTIDGTEVDSSKYYVCGKFYSDTLDSIAKDTLNLYNPPNKESYEQAFRNMTNLMTEACKQSYQRQLGSYVASTNKTVTIDKMDIGFKEWQENGEDKILVRLCVQENSNKDYITIEYKVGADNRIYTYEMW